MKLDSTSGLSLPDPATPTGSATVTIDPRPDQISILPKLELSGQTAASNNNTVLTRALGDDRYFRKDAAVFNVGIGSSAVNSGSMAFGPQAKAKGGADPSFALGEGAVAGLSSTDAGITLPDGIVAGEGGGSTAIGLSAYASYYSMALGNNARAIGNATALGNDSKALGWASVALGGGQAQGFASLALGPTTFTGASGDFSAAIGFNVYASGTRSMAVGTDSNAMGYHSMALNGAWAHAENSTGIGPTVHTYYKDEVVVGIYPETPILGVSTESNLTDPLFVVGNGYTIPNGPTVESNALVVRRNGNAEVKANFSVGQNATVTGASRLQASVIVEGQTDPSDSTNRTVIAKPGQEVLVPEQGDISMGEFRSGSLPLPATP